MNKRLSSQPFCLLKNSIALLNRNCGTQSSRLAIANKKLRWCIDLSRSKGNILSLLSGVKSFTFVHHLSCVVSEAAAVSGELTAWSPEERARRHLQGFETTAVGDVEIVPEHPPVNAVITARGGSSVDAAGEPVANFAWASGSGQGRVLLSQAEHHQVSMIAGLLVSLISPFVAPTVDLSK